MSHSAKAGRGPRNGTRWVAGIVARISGCANQKEVSLDDQVDHGKEVVAENYAGDVEYRVIKTKGKGERLDRPELEEIEGLLLRRELDVLVVEDLGRLVRGIEAAKLCGTAVDHGTRVLAPNDCVDTDDASWEEDCISACRDHVGHNAHTSKRIKHKKMNRFLKFGGAPALPTFGYVKPEGTKTYGDWEKVSEATPVFREWFRILRETRNCSTVAEMLNARGIPTGPYARRKTWDGKMVRRLTANPILKGMPSRGTRHTVKHHGSGRRVSVPNPAGPKYWPCPQLAHVDAAEFDEVNALLTESNKGCGRKPLNGVDPRYQVPRKRTRFPGQHACCWYCGREFLWGASGITDGLMCGGSKDWRCWNSFGFNGPLACRKLVEAVTAALFDLDGFEGQFRSLVERARRERVGDESAFLADLSRREAAAALKKENLLAGVAAYGPKPMFQAPLEDLDRELAALARERRSLGERARREPDVPPSLARLRALIEGEFAGSAAESPEFGGLMRRLVPSMHVYLARLVDGGHPQPRLRAEIDLAGFVRDADRVPGLRVLLSRVVTLDLFEPPQRELVRPEAVRLSGSGWNQREIGDHLGVAQPVVSKAILLDKRMRELDLDSPYATLLEPPSNYPKHRRHLNPKYRFDPLPGYAAPAV